MRNALRFMKLLYISIVQSPYGRLMRLDKPYGYILPLLPTLWIVVLCAPDITSLLWFGLLFTVGAIVARSAGCIINDLADQRFDRLVVRTATRPLVSGEVSIKQAFQLLLVLFAVACCILLTLPASAIYIALFSIIPITIYPFAKRFTYFPQVLLGIVFNIGVLIAGATFNHSKAVWVPLLIYLASVVWTIGYDTIYAYQDIDDDIKYGVKSMAVKLADRGVEVIWRLYQLSILILCIAGLNAHMNLAFYLIMALAAYQLYWQIENLNIKDRDDCARKFHSNVDFALTVLLSTIIGKI